MCPSQDMKNCCQQKNNLTKFLSLYNSFVIRGGAAKDQNSFHLLLNLLLNFKIIQ